MDPVLRNKFVAGCKKLATRIYSLSKSWKVKLLRIAVDSGANVFTFCELLDQTKPLLQKLQPGKVKNSDKQIKELQEFATKYITDWITETAKGMANCYLKQFVAAPILDACFNPDDTGTDKEIEQYGERVFEEHVARDGRFPAVPPAVLPNQPVALHIGHPVGPAANHAN